MDKSFGSFSGFHVRAFTARSGHGWIGIAHVLRGTQVLDRLATAEHRSATDALSGAGERGRNAALRLLVLESLCPQGPRQ